jgi:hypothetical protein
MDFGFDEFDMFTNLLEKDTKYMKKMFKGMGANYRTGGGRRKKNPRGGPGNMDDLLNLFMMPGMMSMGMGMNMGGKPSKKKNNKKK